MASDREELDLENRGFFPDFGPLAGCLREILRADYGIFFCVNRSSRGSVVKALDFNSANLGSSPAVALVRRTWWRRERNLVKIASMLQKVLLYTWA